MWPWSRLSRRNKAVNDLLLRQALRGHMVVVVHQDRFQGSYLAEVLRSAGAAIAGPTPAAAVAADLIAATAAPAALVLSSSVPGRGALIEQADGAGWVTLLLHHASARVPVEVGGAPALTAPYAGFQVVDALANLLASTGPPVSSGVRSMLLDQ